MKKTRNTKKSGIAQVFIYKSKKNEYTAVCLDFDIFEKADSLEKVQSQIREAVTGYIINVCKNKLSDDLLNRHAEKKYWDMYYEYLDFLRKLKLGTVNKPRKRSLPASSVLTFEVPQIANAVS